MHVPMSLYLTNACEKLGVNVAYYEGTDGKLPDFAKMKIEPTSTEKQKEIDLSMRERDENFGMTFTGFLQAAATGTTFCEACVSGTSSSATSRQQLRISAPVQFESSGRR